MDTFTAECRHENNVEVCDYQFNGGPLLALIVILIIMVRVVS